MERKLPFPSSAYSWGNNFVIAKVLGFLSLCNSNQQPLSVFGLSVKGEKMFSVLLFPLLLKQFFV
jgi:hypothetical protein